MDDTKTSSSIPKFIVLDKETSTHNKGHPFDPRNKLVSYAIIDSDGTITFRYYTDPDFASVLQEALRYEVTLVGFNIKFDLHWAGNIGVKVPSHVKIWDCQIAEFIYSGQILKFPSLEESLARWDLPPKKGDLIQEYWNAGVQTEDIPRPIVEEYNIEDVVVTKRLFETQWSLLSDKQKDLVFTEGEDMKALMAAERAGIKLDIERATKEIDRISEDTRVTEEYLRALLPGTVPEGLFNWDSGDHLSAFLFGGTLPFKYIHHTSLYKSGAKEGSPRNHWAIADVVFPQLFKPIKGTELKKTADDPQATTRFYSTDQKQVLARLKTRKKTKKLLLEKLGERSKKIKVKEMLESLIQLTEVKHWEGGILHGQYNQTIAVTGRLSSSAPNMQNNPDEVDQFLVSRYEGNNRR